MQVQKQQLELDMEQQTGSKLGKEYVKAIYCHPAYLTYMQIISCEMPRWMNLKLESSRTGDRPVPPEEWCNDAEPAESVPAAASGTGRWICGIGICPYPEQLEGDGALR